MGLLELALIGVGLSMDAFAVSICKGLSMRKVDKKYMLVLAAFFGGFQALMPTLGWLLGSQFQSYITAIDHWIAFILLALIGGKMILDVIKERGENEEVCPDDSVRIDLKEFFLLAVATSIDALAVGITFAFLQVKLISSVTVIGCITFCFTIAGVLIGNVFGTKFKDKATVLGGVILIAIGVKILLEHLGILG
ncbi:manganese efflux pump MntP family protein [uncultured Eubacterium sp.]|uniref:manganese efflux pump MntP n=1 Tax=uncultured Eubacterium sp. TaxID=165185 RepID=UPI0025DBEF2C|nr:manganese efflux pump MntP family protein [uncultured Eubacterium sp.]MCI6537835.1 manganese efflux pump MntP family protein [Lachnospiraceae bacterium]